MKLFPHLVFSCVDAVNQIFSEARYTDKVLEKLFKGHRKWGSRDRKFVAETVYEVVRHRRFYESVMSSGESIDWVAAHLVRSYGHVLEHDEFPNYDVGAIQKRLKSPYPPAVLHSFPDWLNELGEAEFGGDWQALMQALNRPADVYLRVNTLKSSLATLQAELSSEGLESIPSLEAATALRLVQRQNVFTTKAFRAGLFEVQDVASQQVAPLLDPQPGQRVVDACAGAGGKALHLAALMKNKGKIIAMDIHDWKLQELRKRASRNGVDIIETKLLEGSKTVKRLAATFDRVLLDVPCSGLGVLRRNPDTKWKLTLSEVERLVALQREILTDYSALAKASAVMVYATCSILHRENEEQVQWFLNSDAGQGWRLEREFRAWPHLSDADGFYAARLVRGVV
jgi:16S rRNA (cytosine967-C5)-methyltransferase